MTLAQATKISNSNSLMANQAWHAEDNGDILFAAAPKMEVVVMAPIADLMAEMDADLEALRNGSVQPVARLTLAQMEEIESERIGASICECPAEW